MSAEAIIEGPAYCPHHRVLVTDVRPCPECVLDQEFPAPYATPLELLPPDLQEAASYLHRSERRARAHVRATDPDVRRGRKVRESIAKRDAARPKRTDAEIQALKNEVLALHEKNSHLSWTRACGIVGERQVPPLGRKRVQQLVPGARWPK